MTRRYVVILQLEVILYARGILWITGVIIRNFGVSKRKDVKCCLLGDVALAITRSEAPHEDFIDENGLLDFTYEYFVAGGYECIKNHTYEYYLVGGYECRYRNENIREATPKEQEIARRYHIQVTAHA